MFAKLSQVSRAALFAVAFIAAGFSNALYAAGGKFQFVTGDVQVLNASGQQRVAKMGESVMQGETLISGKPALAQIKMDDGGVLVLWPNSRLKISVYQYNGKLDGTERAEYALTQGGVRSITGEIGKVNRANYKMQTPIAYIGVRGTDHETVFIPQPATGEIPLGPPGVYDKVNVGETFLKNQAGQVVIMPNTVGFAASTTAMPGLLPGIPEFFNAAPPKSKASKSGGGGDAAAKQNIEFSPPPRLATVAAYTTTTTPGVLSDGVSGTNVSFNQGTATLVDQGENAALGVNWGRFDGTYTVAGEVAPTSGSLHFMNANNLTNATQLTALGGAAVVTASYSYAAGSGTSPTDNMGGIGVINTMNMSVNFATQEITALTLDFTTAGNTWQVGANDPNSTFQQFSGNGIGLLGTCIGCSLQPNNVATGTASGAFVGSQAEGVVTSFGVTAVGTGISAAGTALLTQP